MFFALKKSLNENLHPIYCYFHYHNSLLGNASQNKIIPNPFLSLTFAVFKNRKSQFIINQTHPPAY